MTKIIPPWREHRWDVAEGVFVSSSSPRWPRDGAFFYTIFAGSAADLIENMRTMGRCGQAIRPERSTSDHPFGVARRERDILAADGRGGDWWVLVWDQSPVIMWDGRRNTYHPDHLLAAAPVWGRSWSSLREADERAELIARLRVARAQWELDELFTDRDRGRD